MQPTLVPRAADARRYVCKKTIYYKKMMENNHDEIIDQLFEYIAKIDRALQKFHPRKESIGYIIAKIIMLRLEASFSALRHLIKKGFTLESLVLTRFIIEQAAYSYAICKFNDFDNIEKINVTKSITKYKERLKIIGTFYGHLSNFTHLDIYGLDSYAKIENNTIRVEKRYTEKLKNVDLIFTFALAEQIYMDSLCGIIEIIDKNNATYLDVDILRKNLDLFIEKIKGLNLYKERFET